MHYTIIYSFSFPSIKLYQSMEYYSIYFIVVFLIIIIEIDFLEIFQKSVDFWKSD